MLAIHSEIMYKTSERRNGRITIAFIKDLQRSRSKDSLCLPQVLAHMHSVLEVRHEDLFHD